MLQTASVLGGMAVDVALLAGSVVKDDGSKGKAGASDGCAPDAGNRS